MLKVFILFLALRLIIVERLICKIILVDAQLSQEQVRVFLLFFFILGFLPTEIATDSLSKVRG